MNTKSKLKAISIGIAAIMMVSLLAAVTTVSASPGVIVTDCEIGDDNKVYFTIHSDATGEGHMCLNINGEYRERKRYTLNAGETTTLSFRDYRWNGVDDVEVCVDCVDTSCCIPGDTQKPDLIVSDKWEESVNEQVIVHFIIENIGDADAGASTACLEINGIDEDTCNIPALAVGASHVGAFAAEPCPPLTTITVTVCADCTNVVDESDETNNCMTNDFTCPAKPDLVVFEKWEESVDGQVIVHFIIANIGDADAGESYATLFIDDMGVKIQNVWVPEIGPDGMFTGTFEPEDCIPGTAITVWVCADDTNMVDESNEDNNCERNFFTCPILPQPDLIVIEKWEECVDGQVIVHFIIENIGDADAGESYATLYIADMDAKLQNVWVPEIGPGGLFTGTFEPEDCTLGTAITVWVCADDTNMVDESNENNNCMRNFFTCPILPQPDLVVFEKWEECVDGQMIVHFIIENIGDADAGESYATLYIDDMGVKLQNVWVPEIGPGGLFTGTFEPEDCTLGTTITVWVCADDTNMVDESNENNNCEMNYFTCPILPQPDLTVTEMWEEYVDGQVILHFTIENIGNADAGACDATLYINRVLVATQNVGVLGLGLDGTFNGAFAPMLCTPGTTNTVQVCIDDANVIDESDETNNCMTNSFTCPILPQPDLVVIEKWEECVDGQVIVHFIIANIGDANAVASYASLFMFDMDVKLQNVEVPELGPNGFFTGTFAAEDCTLDTPFGVIVCADDTSVVNESNETNNCMINTFTCPLLPKPDLVVIEMWEEPVKADGHVIVHFIIENIGDAEAGESYATLYINDMLVEEQNVWVPALGLSGRFTSEFALELCPLADNITVMVCADDTHVVDESDETNNCRTNYFICPPQGPDLVIEKTVEQDIFDCDTCMYRVSYNVTNIGNEVACGECVGGRNRVVLLLDGVNIDSRQCRRLGPGASVNGNFSWRFDCPCADDFNVTVYVDYFNVVDEANETNNWDINPLHCGLGDIEVRKDVWNTTSNAWEDEILDAVLGDIVEFRGEVENTGCCCELTNMMVTDVLSASLGYVNATPIPHSTTYNADGTTTITWPASVLGMCNTNEYRINTTVIADCGWDRNTMTATATTCTGTVVSDSDSAWVYAPTRAGVTVDKTVLNTTSGQWVDSITVDDGTDLTFRCIVRNTGICQDLMELTVWDTLTNDSLVYNWAYGPEPPDGPQLPVPYVGVDSTKVEWDLPWYVMLAPDEELVFLINATANGDDPDVLKNRVDVTAYSWDWLTGDVVWVAANDTVDVTLL